MTPAQILSDIVNGLATNPPQNFISRAPYRYSFPAADGPGLSVGEVDVALFRGGVPSFHSAALALTTVRGSLDDTLGRLGYMGTPLAIVAEDGDVTAYRFGSPLLPEALGSVPVSQASEWVRDAVLPELDTYSQLTLDGLQGRDLLLAETTASLQRVLAALMQDIAARHSSSPGEAFQRSVAVIRSVLLEDPGAAAPEDVALFAPYAGLISFENIPLEAIGEMYESLGATTRFKRDSGVFYTPAWVARHLVSRMPPASFRGGRAVDPACGSGTFLVCFLERFVDEYRLRHRQLPPAEVIPTVVAGVDVDPVAIASTRLTLDLLMKRLSYPARAWDLLEADSTECTIEARSLIGNLPFGYRTHSNGQDISTAILELWLDDDRNPSPPPDYLGLILPASFSYAKTAGPSRRRLASNYRIDELLSLPEGIFPTSKVETVGVIANRVSDPPSEVLVRAVRGSQIDVFRLYGTSDSYVSEIPTRTQAPWVLSPFYAELASAESAAAGRLGDHFRTRVGLKAYGDDVRFSQADDSLDRRVLDNAKLFLHWNRDAIARLPRLQSAVETLYRRGPVELFDQPKLIVRQLTNRRQRGRLATIPDQRGVWFTHRFAGIWPKASQAGDGPGLLGLAAYLQTGFAELWFSGANPSRTLNLTRLRQLPVPSLPAHWWRRAEQLAEWDSLMVAPRWRSHADADTLFDTGVDLRSAEWALFEQAVFAAFGISPVASAEIVGYLRDYLRVGTYPHD